MPLKIGIAGLGTVGGGALKILGEHAQMIAARAGRPVVITAISARDKTKDRGAFARALRWVDDPMSMATDPDIDVVVELIGGSEGIAKSLVEKSLEAGKSVVTANKALIAHHGVQLAALAEKHGVVLAFEAAVAGGVPIIKALRDGLAANRFTRVVGIINGSCNYILTHMQNDGVAFDVMMKKAHELGYLEADPSFDIDGIDAAHKIAILASLAFGSAPAIDKVYAEGIRHVSLRDITFAKELGCRIKLLAIATHTERGIEQRVHPALVPVSSPLANVNDSYNMVMVEGDHVGTVFFEGRGAGAGPTGSSVVADIMDIARGVHYKPFTLPVAQLTRGRFIAMEQCRTSYYVRLSVADQPGVLADITAKLSAEKISMKAFLQHPHQPGEAVQLVLTTHETEESSMLRAIAAIAKLGSVKEKPYMIRMESN